MTKLVLVRHGQSLWNLENRFTGWTDVDLTPQGEKEAVEAAALLAKEGFIFDICYTSLLKRAIRTLNLILEGLDMLWLPVEKSWKLNERHYGALQGLNKSETTAKYGEEQVFLWRRSYSVPPPPLSLDSPDSPARDRRYADLRSEDIPLTESLKEVVARMVPYWEEVLRPQMVAGQRLLVVAHGNSLRALVKHLDKMSDEDITTFNIPTGLPLVYEFDEAMKPVKRYYLGDPAEAAAKAKAVAEQAAKK